MAVATRMQLQVAKNSLLTQIIFGSPTVNSLPLKPTLKKLKATSFLVAFFVDLKSARHKLKISIDNFRKNDVLYKI